MPDNTPEPEGLWATPHEAALLAATEHRVVWCANFPPEEEGSTVLVGVPPRWRTEAAAERAARLTAEAERDALTAERDAFFVLARAYTKLDICMRNNMNRLGIGMPTFAQSHKMMIDACNEKPCPPESRAEIYRLAGLPIGGDKP